MLVSLLVVVLIIAVIAWLLNFIPMEPPLKTVVMVLFAVIVILYLLGFLGAWGPAPWGYPHYRP